MSDPVRAGTVTAPPRTRALTRLLRRGDRLLEAGHEASARFSRWRLAIFVVGAVGTVALYKMAAFHAGNASLLLFLLIFGTVARYHSRLEARMQRIRHWREIKRQHLARLSLDWTNLPERPHQVPSDHPYAGDLDLVGPTSLLRLLDTTVSTMGRERLTAWLTQQPPPLAAWQARHNLIKELAPLALFRDRLTLAARLIHVSELDGYRIQQALSHAVGVPGLSALLLVEGLLAFFTLGLVGAALFGMIPSYWVLSLALYVFLYMWFLGDAKHVFNRAMTMRDELAQLVSVFQQLEQHPCRHGSTLRALVAVFHTPRRPSRFLRRLARVCAAMSIRAHPLVHLLMNAAGPWDIWFMRRLEQTRQAVAAELPGWLDRLAELEAASALASFAYFHPHYAWPTNIEASGDGQPARIEATGLGHPLLGPATRVTNDFSLIGTGQIVVITGSNMSGKSTFLRTVGINVCLAQAGAPVCATSFQWSWARLLCCIRVTDSLEAGLSYFYAEVKRLRLLLDETRDRAAAPVLFLIDEIFKGTNNRERLAGSRSYITALAQTNGFGLISTHDLELADLHRTIPTITNAHFQETVAAGALQFDYRLRPGPCTTTNALRIMAMEGLPAPNQES
jgi:hypothetical protein